MYCEPMYHVKICLSVGLSIINISVDQIFIGVSPLMFYENFLPVFGEGFKCSSIALSNNLFLSLTDILVAGKFGDGVGDGYTKIFPVQ